MTSFGYRLNPRYAIKECLSCGALYTGDFCCLKGNIEDKILVLKLPKNCANTNVVNAPQEPFVFKQDHGVNPPHIDKCCCECGEALDGIFCQQCTCKSCRKGAHIGYNCPTKVPIVFNPEPCNQTMNNELPQTLPSFDPTCYSDKENSLPCVSKPNFVDESSNIFNPPPQPPIYSCEFCRSNAQYGHYCIPQVPFIYPEPSYSPDFNFPQDIYDFQQHYLYCDQCGGPSQTTLMEQMTTLTSMCEMVCQIVQKKQEEKQIEEEQAANPRYWKIHASCDDDDDYNSAITPVLSIEEPDLVPIPSEFECIPDTMCDVHLVNNPTPLEAKDHFAIVINSNDDISSNVEDSLYNETIEYVEASPQNSELVSLEVAEIVTLEEEEIKDDNMHEKLLNVHLLIANIEALKDNPTPSSELLTKSSSTSSKSFLEKTNTFHNCLPEFENFCFDLEEISSGSTTTHSDISFSEYDSFIFDLSNDQFPPTDRSDFTHEEFVDELAYIISPSEYDCFYFRNLPDPGELIFILNSRIREILSTTRVNLPVEDDHSPLLVYVYSRKCKYSCQRILSSKSSFPQLQLGIHLLHLAGSQPMLKSSYKAKASVIISIPPLVGGVADVVVEIKGI
nr:hypothetical protein [Tanacetum cinerariifolium]